MDENQEGMQEETHEETHEEAPRESFNSHAILWGVAAIILVLALGVWGVSVTAKHQGTMIKQLASSQTEFTTTMAQMQTQLNSLSSQLADVSAAQTAAAQAASAANSPAAKRADTAPLRQMQTRLQQQQKQLKETQDDVAKTRSDLEGSLNSTRDELNGSIAKTHEELVALQNRGERNYYEFDLAKSKRFLRSGPIMLSLRKTDVKHQHLDLAMIVNDNELSKKNVNLYEPVWVYDTNDPMPVQVVVNQIGRDRVHGYVSVPKYRQVSLAGVTPASALSPAPNPNPTATAPLQ